MHTAHFFLTHCTKIWSCSPAADILLGYHHIFDIWCCTWSRCRQLGWWLPQPWNRGPPPGKEELSYRKKHPIQWKSLFATEWQAWLILNLIISTHFAFQRKVDERQIPGGNVLPAEPLSQQQVGESPPGCLSWKYILACCCNVINIQISLKLVMDWNLIFKKYELRDEMWRSMGQSIKLVW